MYNGKYGKLRYGLKDGVTETVILKGDLGENLLAITGFGDKLLISDNLFERLAENTIIRATTLISGSFFESCKLEGKATFSYSLSENLGESIECDASLKKDIRIVDLLSYRMDGDLLLGKNIELSPNLEDNLENHIFIGKVLYENILVAEQLNTEICVNVLEKQIARVDVVLRPGEELRIDSSLFNATLNGDNILHLYDGDWIQISRDTVKLTIQTATGGNVTGKLLYTERYL